MLDFCRFRVLSFDCYGTLIDWESGIFSVLRPVLAAHGKTISDIALLELYAELEAEAEQPPFRSYRQILQSVVLGFGHRLGFAPSDTEIRSLPESLCDWQPFPDTVDALRQLKAGYRLAIISNVDDDFFALTAPKLEVSFDYVITAQQAQAYKPSLKIFHLAHERFGVAPEHWLHIGQSVYHDVVPAQSLGLATVRVNRASPRHGVGAVKAASGRPDVEVSSLGDLAALASAHSTTEN
jgi:2-haloacid dehalogenase